jgi:hypothetical protein
MTATASRARNGVFISYSRHDGEAFARELRQELEARHEGRITEARQLTTGPF